MNAVVECLGIMNPGDVINDEGAGKLTCPTKTRSPRIGPGFDHATAVTICMF